LSASPYIVRENLRAFLPEKSHFRNLQAGIGVVADPIAEQSHVAGGDPARFDDLGHAPRIRLNLVLPSIAFAAAKEADSSEEALARTGVMPLSGYALPVTVASTADRPILAFFRHRKGRYVRY